MEDVVSDSKIVIPNYVHYYEYNDWTKDNPYNLVDKGVEVISIEGHIQNTIIIKFHRLKPYNR